MPDFSLCHQELKRKGMTKILLWPEYQQDTGENAYGYSQFCNLYNDWLKLQKRSMRQHHVAGEKLFLDFYGPTIPVINPDTSEERQAQIFVATLGTSNYTYVEACENQRQESWLMAHVRAFEFFGGVPQLLVPDIRHGKRYGRCCVSAEDVTCRAIISGLETKPVHNEHHDERNNGNNTDGNQYF